MEIKMPHYHANKPSGGNICSEKKILNDKIDQFYYYYFVVRK